MANREIEATSAPVLAGEVPAEMGLLDVLAELRSAGWANDFVAVDGGLRCGACGRLHPPEETRIERLERFEGVSDPGDESIIVALNCVHCHSRGVLVASYGPAASREEADVLVRLTDARR